MNAARLLIHVPPAAARENENSRRHGPEKRSLTRFLGRALPRALHFFKRQRASELRNARLGGPLLFDWRCQRGHHFVQCILLRDALGFFTKHGLLSRSRCCRVACQRLKPRRNLHFFLVQRFQGRDRSRRCVPRRFFNRRQIGQERCVRRAGIFDKLRRAVVNQIRLDSRDRLLAERKRGRLHLWPRRPAGGRFGKGHCR